MPAPGPGPSTPARLPVLFVGHGSPMLALDSKKGAPIRAWGARLPRPRAVLVISAHWTHDRLAVTPGGSIVHDFGGFPDALHRVRYTSPRADELAREVADLLSIPIVERPLDHGVWSPLVHLVPAADLPVAQLSLPSRATPPDLLALGARLAPLRERGVLLVASGSLVHNLGKVDWSDTRPPPCWADDFDHWLGEVLASNDRAALAEWRARGPGADLSHPTDEHLLPLLVAVGAARDDEPVTFPVTGFELGSISRRSVQLG